MIGYDYVVTLEQLEVRVTLEVLVQQVTQAPPAALVQQVALVPLEVLVQQVQQVLANEVLQVLQVLQVPLVLLVPLVNVVQVVGKVYGLIAIATPMEIKFNGITSHGN